MDKTVRLRKNEERRIAAGHLWAFSNEIEKVTGEAEAGDVVRLRTHSGKLLGLGFYHPNSLIAVRLLTRREEEIDFGFFSNRISSALALRRMLYPNAETFRLVHGESDFLPGLVVDKYNECLAVQAFSSGMDRRLTLICDVLESLLHPACIIERNDISARQLEGLEERKGLLRGSPGDLVISEYGIKYKLDLMEGQKTGFFLDQRENRRAIRRYARGATVLDCFSNDGGFALNAAFAEAAEVTAVDVSESAVSRASQNARLNGLEQKTKFIAGDAFDFLAESSEKREKYGLIILDPPSFAKSKKNVTAAKRGYAELHARAFGSLSPGGILATASCSHHIYEPTFLDIINSAARASGREISLLEWRGASADHPVLPAMPETHYLKFGIFRAK